MNINLADFPSLQAAVDAAAPHDKIIVPAGDWEYGAATLKSNLTLHLEAGARLIHSTIARHTSKASYDFCIVWNGTSVANFVAS